MWSGVLTVTASMLLPISSSILRKSLNFLALGKRRGGRFELVVVDVANGHHVAGPAGIVESLSPLPSMPMLAKAIRSLGERLSWLCTAGHPETHSRGGGSLQKLAAVRHKMVFLPATGRKRFLRGNSA